MQKMQVDFYAVNCSRGPHVDLQVVSVPVLQSEAAFLAGLAAHAGASFQDQQHLAFMPSAAIQDKASFAELVKSLSHELNTCRPNHAKETRDRPQTWACHAFAIAHTAS